ncbi:MAG: dTMP kinase [bacterium]|nr:dTMP kinase [bacterium]
MTAKFIVFEGPDGSGTTRQTAFLVDSLRKSGKSVLMTAEPTESKVGQDIRKMLQQDTMPTPDSMQLLFCADRANHVSTVIEPALRKGQIVVCDRFSLSTIVYGAAQGIDKQWLESINAKFPKPDLTFITLPPFDICMERINSRKTQDQFEMENFQRRVYENYKSIEDPSVVFVDTSGSKQETAHFVWRQYQEHFGQISQESEVQVG